MNDTRNGDRSSLRPSLRPSVRPEVLAALFDRPDFDEVKVLDALVSALPSGEATPELFEKLHAAAAAEERAANLGFAYERLSRDARVKLLAKPKQAEFFLAAASFFGETFGDVEAAAAFGDRAYQVAPDDPKVFDRLETILASLQLGTKLGRLYADKARRETDATEKLRLLRAAVDLYEFDGTKEELAPLLRSVVDLDPEDNEALAKLEKLYAALRRFKDLADVLEQAVGRGQGKPVSATDDVRLRLVGLYRGELRDPSRAALHVETLLARDPVSPAALQAAEALIDHRPVAARIAPLLSQVYQRLGRLEDEASTLSLELKVARPPRLADVHRRLAVLRTDVLRDPAGALELLEPLMARDPSDDDLRKRYIEVSGTFHRELEAAKLLSRAVGSVKDRTVRIRVGQDIADLYAAQGDEKRARAVLEPLLGEAEEGPRLAIAKKLSDLHADASDAKGLATALFHVVTLEPGLANRVAAGKRLVELAEKAHLPARFAIAGYRALVGSPRTDEALDRLDALYASTHDDAGSLEILELRAARTKDPEGSKRIALQALELRVARTKDRAQAISLVKEFVRVHGPERAVLERLATLLEQQRDFPGLAATLEQLLGTIPDIERAPLYARLARTRFTELGDRTGAIEALEHALSRDPKEPTARRLAERLLGESAYRKQAAGMLGPVYRAEGNHAGTVRVLETLAELSDQPSEALAALEEAHQTAGELLRDPRRCLEISGRALNLLVSRKSGFGVWLERLRSAAEESGDASRAAASLSTALGDGPIDSADLAALAREAAEASVRAGDVQRAVETYRRVLSFDPSSHETLARVDELLSAAGNPEERLSLHLAALERAESGERRRDLLRAIARIRHRDLGDVAGARQTLEALVRDFPGDVSAHEELVDAYRAQGAREELRTELSRALSYLRGERRTTALLALAREYEESGEGALALASYRELLDGDDLPLDVLPRVSALAESIGDSSTLAAVLERAVARVSDDALQAELFEKLGEVRAQMMGEPTFAVAAFRRAAALLGSVPGAEGSLRRLYSKILNASPRDVEAARYLLDQAVQAGEWAHVPALFSILLRNDPSGAPLAALAGLEERAVSARAIDELVAMIDDVLGWQALPDHRARELLTAKARVLSSHPTRHAEALRTFRDVLDRYGADASVEEITRLVESASPSEAADVRWLYEYRARHAAAPVPVLLEWAKVEEEKFSDPAAAVRILEEVLRENLPLEDRLDAEARLSSLLVERLGELQRGLALTRSILERTPGHVEALRVARLLLRQPATRTAAADLLVGLSGSAQLGANALRALLDETGGTDLEAARARWFCLLVDAHSEDPTSALAVAIEGAEEMPAQDELWDAAERFARRARSPEGLRAAYQRTLSLPLDGDIGERIGKRFVEFHEEWFEEPEAVLRLLERVLELSPRARWALDRIKLLYNAEGRWDELFDLYDRAIAGALSREEREDLLDEAALASKDLANDLPRAIRYLEQLVVLRPDARLEAMLERLYERTGRSRELLSLLARRVAEASPTDAGKLRLRLARLEIDVGEVESAFQRIEQALSNAPEEPLAYELLEAIVRWPGKPRSEVPTESEPAASKKTKAKQKPKAPVQRDVRREAMVLLERRYRASGDLIGVARVLEASLAGTGDPGERLRRLEELVSICLGKIDDVDRAFSHMRALVEMDPTSPAHRERLADVARRMAGDQQRTVAERCDLLEVVAAHGRDGESRRAAAATLATLALNAQGDSDRAVRAYRTWLDEAPEDAEILSGLVRALEGARRFPELVEALVRRSALIAESARDDLVKAARIQSEELRDVPSAIATWRKIRVEHGAGEDTFDALASLLVGLSRWDDLAELYEEAAASAPAERARELYRQLGDIHRDRTGNPVRALEAYGRAGDFERIATIGQHVADFEAQDLVATKVLELCEGGLRGQAAVPAMTEAAEWAIRTLTAAYREQGAHERTVDLLLRAALLPFGRDKQRKMRRDAAFAAADKLADVGRAIAILTELFSQDSADDVAAQSVSRFARLLDESGRHAELSALWEQQAKARAEAKDKAGAAALWSRAGEVWEQRLSEPDRAIAAHRQGAALGGEASLEALARIYTERKNHRAAAATLEWLVAQSTREELGDRVLRLSDAYLASGEWERACARLESAAASAIDASPVRQRLIELYRRHAVWEPLSRLLVSEADRVPDDRSRLALLREAAEVHLRQRGDAASAVPLLVRATELDPEDPTLPLALADVLRTSARFEEAEAVLRARVDFYGHRRPKDRAVVHLYLARVALAAGRRAEALAELDVGAKIDPAHPGILYELGRLALEEGQLTRAERTYRALLLVLRKPDEQAAEAPSRAEIYLDLSEIAAAQGESERATDLIESAFDAALESPRDAECLERALGKAGRHDLLVRAVENRLAAASDPAVAARALSDLVMLHSEQLGRAPDLASRVVTQANRIHRDLDAGAADEAAWAALSKVYEWLGDRTLEARALERRVAALLESSVTPDLSPLLRLSQIRLSDLDRRGEGVALAEQALDRGADPEQIWALVRNEGGEQPRDASTLKLLERMARESGRDAALVEVMALRAEAFPLDAPKLREAFELAQRHESRALMIRLLEGALSHSVSGYADEDAAWVRVMLGRLSVADGNVQRGMDLLEEASALLHPERARGLALEVARHATEDPVDLSRAARLYERVLQHDPSDRAAWEPLLEVYRKTGDRKRLIELIEATAPLVESPGDRGRLRLEEATLMLEDGGDDEKAIGLLSEIVSENPGLRDAAELFGKVLSERGRVDEFAVLLASQLDHARSSGDAKTVEGLSLELGAVLERQGHVARALETYRNLLDWNAESLPGLRAVARLEEASGCPAREIADTLEKLVPLEEGDARPALARRLVELRMSDGDPVGADRALEVACASNPHDAGLRERLLARRLELSDWTGAGNVLRSAARAEPTDTSLLLRAVEVYERGGDLDSAVSVLSEAFARGAEEPDLYAERARLLREKGNWEDALADLETAHARGGGRAPELAAALEAALTHAEGELRVRYTLRLVDVLEEMGETTRAREQLVRLVKVVPKEREALRRLATLASAEARWDEAAATYRRLIPLEEGPAMVAAALNLADACEQVGKLLDARGGLERALEAAPGSAPLRARLIQVYECTGAHRELAELLLAEARGEPDVTARTNTLLRVAELYLEKDGDARAAIRVLEEVRHLVPESVSGAVLFARAEATLGRRQAALLALEEVVSAHRGRRAKELSIVHREISSLQVEAGDLPKALESLSRAFDLDMRNGDLAMQLGHLALDLGDTETAQKAFRSVTMMKLKQAPSNEGASAESKAVSYYHLSRIAQDQGDVRKARLMASKALTENPNHTEAQALLAELKS